MYRPGYIELLNNGELCPHKCGVDRARDERVYVGRRLMLWFQGPGIF